MITCEVCGHESRVIETRRVKTRLSSVREKGRRMHRARTVARTRECEGCKYRWRTMEVPIRIHSKVWANVAKEPVSRRTRKTPTRKKPS